MQNKEITLKKWTIIFGIQLMRKTVLLYKEIVNSVQLSREGEVNSGNIYRDAKRRGIYLALFTAVHRKKVTFCKLKTSLSRNFDHSLQTFRGFCQVHFYDFVANSA